IVLIVRSEAMQLYQLPYQILRFAPQAQTFLNGLMSNAMGEPKNAFLDRQGRIVATTDQLSISEDEVWQVVASSVVTRLKDHLQKMLMLSTTELSVLDC